MAVENDAQGWPIHPFKFPKRCLHCGTMNGFHTGPHYGDRGYALYDQDGNIKFDSRTAGPRLPKSGEQLQLF